MHSLLHEAFSVALRWRGTAFFPEGQISQSFSHEAKCILCHSAVGVQTSSCQTLGAPGDIYKWNNIYLYLSVIKAIYLTTELLTDYFCHLESFFLFLSCLTFLHFKSS